MKKIKRRRSFSESFKKARIKEFEKGQLTVSEISREYKINTKVIYDWIHKFSAYSRKGVQVIVEEKSLTKNNQKLREENKELQALAGRQQMKIEYLEKLIELSSEDLGVDLKKKLEALRSNGSGKIPKNTRGK